MRRVGGAGAVPVTALGLAVGLPDGPAAGSAVPSQRVIGYGVAHRPVVAYRLGNPTAARKVGLLGQMPGDEHAGVVRARAMYTFLRAVRPPRHLPAPPLSGVDRYTTHRCGIADTVEFGAHDVADTPATRPGGGTGSASAPRTGAAAAPP